MNQLRETVLKILSESRNDDNTLVTALNRLAGREGNRAFSVIVHVLTNLQMDDREAAACWLEIMRHRTLMIGSLGRPVDIRTVFCDYFCSVHRRMVNPKVVEMDEFENTARSIRYDALTGLYSRDYLDKTLKREVARAGRYDTDISLLFLDLDDFKSQNDTYGHPAGDHILREVARIVKNQIRTQDIAARYGGEEVVIIMPHTGKRNALFVAERIRYQIESMQFEYDGFPIRQTISGGLAAFPLDGRNAISLVKCADKALYSAKNSGKNRIVLYSVGKPISLPEYAKGTAYQ